MAVYASNQKGFPTMVQRSLSTNLSKNTALFHALLPLDDSFDLITRDLKLGNTPAYWIGVNGFCKTEILQQIFSDLQDPLYTLDSEIRDLPRYVQSKLGYAQVSLTSSIDTILQNILSGPSVLLVEGFAQAVIIDVRTYPVRSISEPDTERITRGARDGFVETLLFNTNLIRRRVRSPKLTFSICSLGAESRTDVAIAYLADQVNEELLDTLKKKLSQLQITSLTMGSKSLEELLIKKRWWNPLPSIQLTERPDVACSYLCEGHSAHRGQLPCRSAASRYDLPVYPESGGLLQQSSDRNLFPHDTLPVHSGQPPTPSGIFTSLRLLSRDYCLAAAHTRQRSVTLPPFFLCAGGGVPAGSFQVFSGTQLQPRLRCSVHCRRTINR